MILQEIEKFLNQLNNTSIVYFLIDALLAEKMRINFKYK